MEQRTVRGVVGDPYTGNYSGYLFSAVEDFPSRQDSRHYFTHTYVSPSLILTDPLPPVRSKFFREDSTTVGSNRTSRPSVTVFPLRPYRVTEVCLVRHKTLGSWTDSLCPVNRSRAPRTFWVLPEPRGRSVDPRTLPLLPTLYQSVRTIFLGEDRDLRD